MAVALGVAVAVFASSFAARRCADASPWDAMHDGTGVAARELHHGRLLAYWAGLLIVSVTAFVIEDYSKSIAWGNFGSTVWNASIIVVAIPIMHYLAPPVSRTLSAWFGAEGKVAAGSLFRAGARSGVTVAAIALILTIAIMLSSLVLSCRQSLSDYFAGFMACDLTVSAVTTEGGWLETPLPRSVADSIGELPGVARVDTARVLSGQLFRGQRIALLALSSSFFDPRRAPSGWYREGSAKAAEAALRAGEAVSISTSLADRFDLHVGDSIELESPTGIVSRPIVGVVPDYVSDRGSVILDRGLLARRWQDDAVNRFPVFAGSGVGIDDLRDTIKTSIGARYALKILSTKQLLDYHTDQIDQAFAVMNSVQLLVILVTIVGIFDLLISRISERRRELALWQVIGAGRRSLRRSVTIESATIGAIGAVLGVVMGYLTAWLWIRVHFHELLGYYVEYHFATAATAWYVTLVIVMAALAGYAASHRATRESVLDGIRND